MATKRGGRQANRRGAEVSLGNASSVGAAVPEALRAVTLKAMARDRAGRYSSVWAFAADIEAYQNGFATSAEDAGAWKRVKLWVGRNKVLAGSAAAMFVVVSGFTARVVQKGREASEALQSLRETAPMLAVRTQDALRLGQFEEALKAASFAVRLETQNGESLATRPKILCILKVVILWSKHGNERL